MLRTVGPVLALLALAFPFACASADPHRYRLTASGEQWYVAGGDRVLDDLAPRYPDYFEVILDPGRSDEPSLLELRDDLERDPTDRHSYDALNAIAIGYFEINQRSELARSRGDVEFLTGGMRAAHLAAVPWKAYGLVQEPALRDAILDFYEDAGTGDKPGARKTAGRLVRIVASLAAKEPDPARRARIEALAARLDELDRRQRQLP